LEQVVELNQVLHNIKEAIKDQLHHFQQFHQQVVVAVEEVVLVLLKLVAMVVQVVVEEKTFRLLLQVDQEIHPLQTHLKVILEEQVVDRAL
jgi:hypothetical protein